MGAVPPIHLREIDLNLTNFCNLECIHCSYSSTTSKHEPALTTDVIKTVLVDAAGLGTKVVHWSGGEPATRPDMAELIAHAIALGYGMRLLRRLPRVPQRLRLREHPGRRPRVPVRVLRRHG